MLQAYNREKRKSKENELHTLAQLALLRRQKKNLKSLERKRKTLDKKKKERHLYKRAAREHERVERLLTGPRSCPQPTVRSCLRQSGPVLPAERQNRGALPDQPGDESGERIESLLPRPRLDQALPQRPGQRDCRAARREDLSALSRPRQQPAGLHGSALGRRQRHRHRSGLQKVVAQDAGAKQKPEERHPPSRQTQGTDL